MYVYKEVLSVSTRKGTTICEFTQNPFNLYTRVFMIEQ